MGICGTGMGSFAGLLKAAGHDVRGSDENVYPPMSDKLAAWGIEVRAGYRPENLDDPVPDQVIVGNVIRRDNPEAEAMVARGLPYTSFPKALGEEFLAPRHSVVVSGTHGKTTTTSLIAWILTSSGLDPSLLVGGVPGNFGEGFRLGEGPHFVVEGDEYDTAYFDKVPKFVHYHPRSLIVTSLEFDHADIYPDVEAIEDQFSKLFHLVPEDGRIFACASAPRVMRLAPFAEATVETYSARPGQSATWTVANVETSATGAEFTVFRGRVSLARFRLGLTGLHNVENALAAIAFAATAGVSVQDMVQALETFQGVARRQTVRAEIDGVRIIDDFAHHPTAVRETVAAVCARYPDDQVIAIFEPRTATSSRAYFQDAYAEAFAGAHRVIIAGVGRKEIDASERLDVERLAQELGARGIDAATIADVDDIVAELAANAKPKQTLLFMSNGGFGGIYEKVENALRSS